MSKLVKKQAEESPKKKREIIIEGKQEFVICPKCGWKHEATQKVCRFCGQEL